MAGSRSAGRGRIFISYRREETAYPAGWLFDRLAARFGRGQIFKDVDSIELGEDFVEVITTAVGSCDVLLALIGNRWLSVADAAGARRLDDPDDFVRLEIEAALARDVRVIPVLVEGATMPRADELPPTLAALARRQALELSPSRFNFDTNRLLDTLDRALEEVRSTPVESPATRRRVSKRAQLLAGVGALAAGLVAAGTVVFTSGSNPPATASSHAAVVFRDDFSTRRGGWDDAGNQRNGGRYANGAYRLATTWASDHWSDHGFPSNVSAVYPTAPQNVRVDVIARRLSGGDSDAAYGIACRANGSTSYYQFGIWRDHVSIEKFFPEDPFYDQLRSKPADAVRPNGRNHLQATCTTDGAGVVHLVFVVNGIEVARTTDDENPLRTGTVGLVVSTGGKGANAIEAEFDDFVVTRL